MDDYARRTRAAQTLMRGAFIDLLELAWKAGADERAISDIQHQFWDGNEEMNKARIDYARASST